MIKRRERTGPDRTDTSSFFDAISLLYRTTVADKRPLLNSATRNLFSIGTESKRSVQKHKAINGMKEKRTFSAWTVLTMSPPFQPRHRDGMSALLSLLPGMSTDASVHFLSCFVFYLYLSVTMTSTVNSHQQRRSRATETRQYRLTERVFGLLKLLCYRTAICGLCMWYVPPFQQASVSMFKTGHNIHDIAMRFYYRIWWRPRCVAVAPLSLSPYRSHIRP